MRHDIIIAALAFIAVLSVFDTMDNRGVNDSLQDLHSKVDAFTHPLLK